jgi:uncharacterized membrane protein YGL010W
MIGIPPVIISVLLFPVSMALFSFTIFPFSVSLFVGGYVLQFLGHVFDGTEPGEWTALKRLSARATGTILERPKSRRRVA